MLYIFFLLLLVLTSLCLIVVVLIQSGRGAGLSGAFGMGEGQAVFGSRAGDVLTKATEIFAITFMILCVLVTYQSKHAQDSIMSGSKSAVTSSRSAQPLPTMEELEKQNALTNTSEDAEVK